MSDSRFGSAYFDPETPKPPAQIFGFPTETALQFSHALSQLGPASPRLSADGPVIKGMIELFPLLARAQAGEIIRSQDVRPYRRAIKQVVPPLEAADGILTTLSIIPPVGVLGRVVLNKGIELAVVKKIPEAFAKGAEYIPRAEPYVEVVEQFDNPKEEFVEELQTLLDDLLPSAESQDIRISADDIAARIGQGLVGRLIQVPESTIDVLPLLSGVMVIKNKRSEPLRLPPHSILALLAPEILTMLAAPLPKDIRGSEIIAEVKCSRAVTAPHPHTLQNDELADLREAAPVLLVSVRDLLPESGLEFREKFETVKRFLTTSYT